MSESNWQMNILEVLGGCTWNVTKIIETADV